MFRFPEVELICLHGALTVSTARCHRMNCKFGAVECHDLSSLRDWNALSYRSFCFGHRLPPNGWLVSATPIARSLPCRPFRLLSMSAPLTGF